MSLINKIKNLFLKDSDNERDDVRVPFDLDNMWLQERMSFEWEAIEMGKEPIRIVENPQYNLLDLLNTAGVNLKNTKIGACYAVTEDWASKDVHKIDNIRDYSIFEDYFTKNSSGNVDTNGISRMVMVFIGFDENGKDGFVVVHLHPWGHMGEDMSIMARLSIVKMMDDDDKVVTHKSLVVFDIRNPKDELKKIEGFRRTAVEKLRKGVELNELESFSVNRHNTIGSYRGMAAMRMKDQRWGDAASDLIEAYRWLKSGVLTNRLDNEGMKVFCDVCYQLGMCYYKRMLYSKAAFYFELAQVDDSMPEYKEKLDDCRKKLHDIRIPGIREAEDSEIRSNSLLGELLNSCYDVLPEELSKLVWVDNDTCVFGEIIKQKDIWNLDVKELLNNHKYISLYLSYRATTTVLDDEFLESDKNYTVIQPQDKEFSVNENFLKQTTRACVDKSICRVDNEIIITLKRDGSLGTMTIMVPEFNLSYNNNNHFPQSITVRFALKELMLKDTFNQIRSKATEKNGKKEALELIEYLALGHQEEAHYLFIQGKIAFDNHLWGDVIYYISRVYSILAPKWNTTLLDAFDRYLCWEMWYMLGFTYVELRQYEISITYLGIIADDISQVRWTIEYINSLTNSKDVRASGYVNYQLRKINDGKYNQLEQDELKQYHSFLKRRYGYILIDQGRIKEAKEYFTSILDDPDGCEFAKGELNYISENYSDEIGK